MMKTICNKSVLVVDDDAGILRALDKVLSGEGATVTCAQWAGDAVDILTEREKRFHLVITDLRMPVFSGMTALYAIHKVFPDLPVIILTAFGSPEVRAECLRQGAAAFLEKPLDSEHLLEEIRRVFTSRETHATTSSDGDLSGARPHPKTRRERT